MNRQHLLPGVAASVIALAFSTSHAGLSEGYQAFTRGDYAVARDELSPLAENGDGIAAYYLGLMYWDGQGVSRDVSTGLTWIRQAAASGHAAAQFALAMAYGRGQVVTQDYQVSARWMLQAAEGGHANAQFYIGTFYADGRGIVENDTVAYEWIQRSVENGASQEELLAGLLYLGAAREWGRGMSQDLVDAYKWYALASGYSVNERRIHDEAARAMGALSTRMASRELTEARRLAQAWAKEREIVYGRD